MTRHGGHQSAVMDGQRDVPPHDPRYSQQDDFWVGVRGDLPRGSMRDEPSAISGRNEPTCLVVVEPSGCLSEVALREGCNASDDSKQARQICEVAPTSWRFTAETPQKKSESQEHKVLFWAKCAVFAQLAQLLSGPIQVLCTKLVEEGPQLPMQIVEALSPMSGGCQLDRNTSRKYLPPSSGASSPR